MSTRAEEEPVKTAWRRPLFDEGRCSFDAEALLGAGDPGVDVCDEVPACRESDRFHAPRLMAMLRAS